MFAKITVVAALALLGFLSIAEAEGVRRAVTSTPVSDASVSAAVIPGWSAFHIAHCLVDDGVLYFYPLENIGFVFFSTSDIFDFPLITPACQTGNLVAIFITPNGWGQFYTFTFK